MQSYEEAGGYGLPAYYDMGMAAGGFGGAGGFMANPLQAFAGFDGMGMGGGLGVGGGRGRGAMRGRGGAMRGGRGGMGGGLGMGAGATMGRGGAAGGRGGKMMRGRGGPSQRFNPLGGKKNGSEEAAQGHIVFCYNIGQHTSEEDVRALFSLYGTVTKVDVIWDHAKNITKGYAFITMPDQAEATYAIEQLNGYNYSGKPLQVSFKSDKK